MKWWANDLFWREEWICKRNGPDTPSSFGRTPQQDVSVYRSLCWWRIRRCQDRYLWPYKKWKPFLTPLIHEQKPSIPSQHTMKKLKEDSEEETKVIKWNLTMISTKPFKLLSLACQGHKSPPFSIALFFSHYRNNPLLQSLKKGGHLKKNGIFQ